MTIVLIIALFWIACAILSSVLLDIELPDQACYLFWLVLWPFVVAAMLMESFDLWKKRVRNRIGK